MRVHRRVSLVLFVLRQFPNAHHPRHHPTITFSLSACVSGPNPRPILKSKHSSSSMFPRHRSPRRTSPVLFAGDRGCDTSKREFGSFQQISTLFTFTGPLSIECLSKTSDSLWRVESTQRPN